MALFREGYLRRIAVIVRTFGLAVTQGMLDIS